MKHSHIQVCRQKGLITNMNRKQHSSSHILSWKLKNLERKENFKHQPRTISSLASYMCKTQIQYILCSFIYKITTYLPTYLHTYHWALQPWMSLGLLYNQSPLFTIPHLLFQSFHLHFLQVTLNVVWPFNPRSSFPSFGISCIFPGSSVSSKYYLKIHFLPHRKHCMSSTDTNWLILCRKIIIFYFENDRKHVSTLYRQTQS
jgi:hypothetical protein